MARARPLATPLTVSGVSTAMGHALERAGRRAGRPVLAAPAGPLGSYPPQQMRPGAAVGVSYSMGDIQIGAIGTVAYTDGDRVWAFGHPFENAGARRLFLQDAYVYRVIDNPVAIPDAASTYKFASLGHTLGTISNDERDAVAGRTGALPPTVPIRVFANDLDTGRRQVTGIRAADESRIGLPEGASPLVVRRAARRHRGRRLAPAQRPRPAVGRRVRADLDRRPRAPGALLQPLRVGVPRRRGLRRHGEHGRGARVLGRLRRAGRDRRLPGHAARIGEVAVRIDLRRGERRAFLRSVKLPRRVRPGQRVRARVRAAARARRDVRAHLRDADPARPARAARARCASPAPTPTSPTTACSARSSSTAFDDGRRRPGPAQPARLAARIRSVRRYDGVRVRTGGGDAATPSATRTSASRAAPRPACGSALTASSASKR